MEQLIQELRDIARIAKRYFDAHYGPPILQAKTIQDTVEVIIYERLRFYLYVLSPTALTLTSTQLPGVQFPVAANTLTIVPNFDGMRFTTTGTASPVDITLLHSNEKLA